VFFLQFIKKYSEISRETQVHQDSSRRRCHSTSMQVISKGNKTRSPNSRARCTPYLPWTITVLNYKCLSLGPEKAGMENLGQQNVRPCDKIARVENARLENSEYLRSLNPKIWRVCLKLSLFLWQSLTDFCVNMGSDLAVCWN